MNEQVSPRLIAALIAGHLYISHILRWADGEAPAKAQALFDSLDLVYRGEDLRPYLVERYVENLLFVEIAHKRGRTGKEWARVRIARALRLARWQLRERMDEVRALIS